MDSSRARVPGDTPAATALGRKSRFDPFDQRSSSFEIANDHALVGFGARHVPTRTQERQSSDIEHRHPRTVILSAFIALLGVLLVRRNERHDFNNYDAP